MARIRDSIIVREEARQLFPRAWHRMLAAMWSDQLRC